MKPKLYVETSVVGYLTNRISRDLVTATRQQITREWWDKRRHAFALHCSVFVIDEASAGDARQAKQRLAHLNDVPVLELSPEATRLARALLKRKALPAKAEIDAFHLAIAAVNDMGFLLTWNCSHLANASMRPVMERVCKKAGYRCPIICTPEQLLKG
jgi:hypothetical protein